MRLLGACEAPLTLACRYIYVHEMVEKRSSVVPSRTLLSSPLPLFLLTPADQSTARHSSNSVAPPSPSPASPNGVSNAPRVSPSCAISSPALPTPPLPAQDSLALYASLNEGFDTIIAGSD